LTAVDILKSKIKDFNKKKLRKNYKKESEFYISWYHGIDAEKELIKLLEVEINE